MISREYKAKRRFLDMLFLIPLLFSAYCSAADVDSDYDDQDVDDEAIYDSEENMDN
jgi:hypothetical protein